MTVGELVELLRGFDPGAEVVITTQPNYPMEHAIAGVAVRANLSGESESLHQPEGAAKTDVILVEGKWLRYGDLAAWDSARRR
ncbi:MAG TPA: hypothetical protein VFT22_20235 [Kofleriaceae bacterium]|nr:hypothetical protein [Kofleriaceae bacterium]